MARNSYVDETLFGCSTRSPKACGPHAPAGGPSPCRGSPAAAKAAAPIAVGKGGAVLLSRAHLDRMMQVLAGAQGVTYQLLMLRSVLPHMGCHSSSSLPAPSHATRPQKSPVLTPEEQEAARREAQARLEQELADAKAARAAREAAAAEAEARRVQPKTEMELLRERERREAISRAQLALLVRAVLCGEQRGAASVWVGLQCWG